MFQVIGLSIYIINAVLTQQEVSKGSYYFKLAIKGWFKISIFISRQKKTYHLSLLSENHVVHLF